MYRQHFKIRIPSRLLALLLVLQWAVVASPAFADSSAGLQGHFSAADVMLLAQADNDTSTESDNTGPPAVNSLFPNRVVQPVAEDKKCMVVCASWGEECTYVDRGMAGTTRSCRRTCQQFTEECF